MARHSRPSHGLLAPAVAAGGLLALFAILVLIAAPPPVAAHSGGPDVDAAVVAAQVITDTEILVLQQVEEEMPHPCSIEVEGTAYTLTCTTQWSHVAWVTITRYDSADEAEAAFETARGDRPLRSLHCYPAYKWQYDLRPGDPTMPMRHRIYAWQADRWLIYAESFDDTHYELAPAPRWVSEQVYVAAGDWQLFPPHTCLGTYLPIAGRADAVAPVAAWQVVEGVRRNSRPHPLLPASDG